MAKAVADVSEWQGKIDWKRLKREVDFAVIRTQDGSNYEDKRHKVNEAEAVKQGVPFGSYAFVRIPAYRASSPDFPV